MKRFLFIILLPGLMVLSCARPAQRIAPVEEETAAATQYDPLATPADREVVPEVYPVTVAVVPDAGDSLVGIPGQTYNAFDSTASEISPTEVYRVQVFTSRLYAEANAERALAEEIFNLPVHLDYEVPYYKLRVGDFLTRGDAEEMVSEIRSIGYRNAWVARVVLRVREVPEFDLSDEPILPVDSGGMLVEPSDTIALPEKDDNR
ncbi:MAG: SPOR domain-containing protein [FCB group bacterium]|nr:SPOR domain-containing protein [FCB group bacterium]